MYASWFFNPNDEFTVAHDFLYSRSINPNCESHAHVILPAASLSVHYWISKLCRVSVTLGKVFAECNTRQTTLGKESHGNADFAECRITGTRQISHVAPPLVRRFAECLMADTRQSLKFCRVS